MRLLISLLSLCLLVTRAQADEKLTVDALLDIVANPDPIPYAQRQAARQALIDRPYNEVLPKLAARIANAPPEWSTRIAMSGSGAGLGDEHAPPGEQAIWALEQVWWKQTYGPKPPAFAKDLVRYLGAPEFHKLRSSVIDEIAIYWCDDAELAIVSIFRDAHESTSLRYRAANALRHHARDKYLNEMLDLIEANPTREAFYFIRDLLQAHFPRYADRPVDARLLVIAHDLMEREIMEVGQTQAGYSTALSMGEFIATRNAPPDARDLPNPFAVPKEDRRRYEADGNLKDAFFEAPVIKARAWWSQNEKQIRAATTRPARP